MAGPLKHLLGTGMTTEGQEIGQFQMQGNVFTLCCEDPSPPTEMEAQSFAAAGFLLLIPPEKDR